MSWKFDGRKLTLFVGLVSLLSAAFGSLDKSPRIITQEGNVILEAGINNNITIRLQGRSRLMVNGLDLIDLLSGERRWTSNGTSLIPIDGVTLRVLQDDVNRLKSRLFGRGGLNARIRLLQNRTQISSPTIALRRAQRRISNMENKIQNMVRKLKLDNCSSNPCENGGSCINLFDGFLCKCLKGFEGSTCSADVNECALFAGTDIGCQNGAQCINQFGSYSCICNSGWQGIHCNQKKTDCLHSSNLELCGHGTCVNVNDNFGYRCICEQGWKSNGLTPSCSVDIDECKEYSSPCTTKCINLPGSFICAPCEAGYTGNGLSCRDIDECSIGNGGCSGTPFVPCINTYGSFHCGECPVGWVGDGRLCTRNAGRTCATNNLCHSAAICQETPNTIVCSCPVGMIGNGIGPNGCLLSGRNMCTSNPCLNGGSCMDTGNGSYTCLCPLGFRLPNCERNPCTLNPCLNGGTCRPNGNSYLCTCVTGYGGRRCDSQRSRCGQYITADQGNLKYPLNDLYNHNVQCSWVIRTDEEKVLNITFSKFEIEDSLECHFDWLQMHDGPTAASQLLGRFCGSNPPLGGNIITTTNRIYFWFKSDNSTAKAGFDLSWTSIDPICGGIVEFDSHATIASPGSPGSYPRNRDCKWHLKAPNTKRIKLVFFSLQIETHSDCNHDYVEISDAISATRLEIFCNSSNPAPLTVPSNEIIVHFHSDNEGMDLGFQIHASTVERIPGCGGTYTERNGIIVSPVGFEGSMSCEYTVRYPKGLKVQLEVTEFKMGDGDCIEIFNVDSRNKVSVGRWCENMNVPIFKSTGNEVQINYYSKGGTFKMSYGTICEYTFENSAGTITSPNYPSPYPADETCTYEIIGESNQVVSLEFKDMDLESNGGINACWFDYITITDGSNATAGGPYCGTTIPPKIVSSTNLLKLILRTDRSNSGKGFSADYTLIDTGNNCGGIMRKPSGEIKLPMSGNGEYQHELSCIWSIIAPTGYGIQLSWLSFNVESSNDCIYDFLEVYDSDQVTPGSAVNQKFCGNILPPAMVSATNILTLKFTSDSSDAEDGFVAKYNFVDVSSLCGGAIFASNGQIKSPHWPMGYQDNLNCSWSISVQTGHQIELIVKSMDLEESDNCERDWLEIRNGGSGFSPLIGRFCGQTIPNRIPSFTHQIHVNFKTDSQIGKSGFSIEWQTIASGCGGVLTTDHGSVASPFYPQYYSNDAQCEWRISVSKGSTISMHFEDLSMETLLSCTYDFVDIYDGHTSDRRRIGRYCDMPDNAHRIETTGSDALIRFQTDSSNTDRGFYLSYVSNCNHLLNTTHGAIESPNFGDNNPSEVNCTWTIQAPKGNRVLLDFAILGQKQSEQKSDYVYFKEDGNDTIIQISQPRRIESQGNTVQVWLNNTSTYFRMEYAMKGCIGSFHRESGEFTSPEYPNVYPNDISCLWQIETDIGKAIELVFSSIDIDSTNCSVDGIQVWNTPQKYNLIGTFCGKKNNLTVTSTGHTMLVQFHSDSHGRGRGFAAKYRTIQSKCGGKLNFPQGSIHSPNYPKNYDSNLHCEWLISVSEHSTMKLTIDELDVEDSYGCAMDALRIYDGSTDVGSQMLKEACGEEVPAINVFQTTSNTALLVFDTDSDTEFKGFKVSFKENCGKRILVNDTGRIRFDGSDQQECLWVFEATDMSKHVTFTTTHIRVTTLWSLLNLTDDQCDGVAIYDGDFKNTSDVRPKKRFCSQHPPAVTSFGHTLTIKIYPHSIAEFEGFYTIMDNNCGGQLNSLRGTFASPSYPITYPLNIECIWEIVANDGNSLSLTIQNMDIDKTDDCNADYLEVREGSSSGRLIGVFCGDDIPAPLIGQKALWIKFNSDDNFVRRGFIAEYGYAFHSEVNGTGGIIESPQYPRLFTSMTEHSWRISVPRGNLIMLAIEHFEKAYESFNEFYNGYDDQAELIEYPVSNIIRTDTNILYMKSSRGVFRYRWYKVSKQFMADNETSIKESSKCSNNMVSVGVGTFFFNSPGFPNGYDTFLNCSWIIVPVDQGSHAIVSFLRIDLENDLDCASDRVVIYSSADMTNWKQLDKKCKMQPDSFLQYSSDSFMKVEFITDMAINKTGFSATASSKCGSTLTNPSGIINATNYNYGLSSFQMDCVWKIQVRTARRIKITFLESQLSVRNDSNTECRTYVLLKNGISEHSPNLGNGKYCENGLRDIPITSSNEAYVKFMFEREAFSGPRVTFKYEEVMNECSQNINLDVVNPSVVLKSDNYPNIPHPHTICVWNIRAPVNRLIAVDFADPMDLKKTDLCDSEYVELHDGSTELSPLIGRFCGKSIPNTQYSSGNILRLSYFTDVAEPHIGFMVNVSLAICGGTYRQLNGTISAPMLLGVKTLKENFSCNYSISLAESNAVNLTIDSIQLPSTYNCSEGNHLKITPIYAVEDEGADSKEIIICGNEGDKNFLLDTNKVQISYSIINTDFTQNSFKLTYQAVGHQCGRMIEAESGILKSPGYFLPVRFPTRCMWKLKVPKGRRIKIEFLEFNIVDISTNVTPRFGFGFRIPGRLLLANDFEMKSVIARITGNPPAVLYSSDNLMSVVSFEVPATQKQGFKLRFSSEEESILCNDNFNRVQGDIHFQTPQNISAYCRYNINVRQNETMALSVSKIEVFPAIYRDYYFCVRHGPLAVQDMSGEIRLHWFCGNRNESTLRLPYSVMFDIVSNTHNKLTSLDLKFARHNCGGVFVIGNQFQLREPSTLTPDYGAMDCVWKVLPNPGDLNQFDVSLSVDFKLKCDEQYLIVYSDSTTTNSPHLGRFCNQATVSNLVAVKDLLIEYHTSNYELGSTFNLTATVGTGCGGELSYPYRMIDFRKQYQNNVECIWTIRARKEYHIGLRFSGRFFIESSPNCTKDYILVQEQVGSDSQDEWNDIQRICGREPPALVNSTTNVMRFIFRSDDSGTGDGFTATFERNCGGVFYAGKEQQLLSSPNYPSSYDYNLTCNYTVIPSDEKRSVLVQIKDFMLEDSPPGNCIFDNLTVYVSSEEPVVLCGNNHEEEFRSTNPISFVFKSDGSYSRKGFLLQYGDEMCGGNIEASTTIATPKQRANSKYPSNTICIWNITAPEGSKIMIKFEQFEFEGSNACSYDYVLVYSGKVPVPDQLVARLCGNFTGKLPPLTIKSNSAIIQSVSDQSEPSVGFSALVTIMKNCDKDIELHASDSYLLSDFATDNDNNLDCGIVFKAPPGNQMLLEFSSFHIEDSLNCNNDFVQIRDGGGLFADEIGKYCGHTIPNPVMSSRSTMYLRFVSDSSETSSGFSATIKVIPLACGATEMHIRSNQNHLITIGEGGNNYLPNMNCIWHIRSDYNIRLDFKMLDIQGPDENGTCSTDYLKIYNGQLITPFEGVTSKDVVFNGVLNPSSFDNANTEHVFCGQETPEGYYTNNQEVYIKFSSDSSIEKSGFRILVTTANECFKNFTNTQGRIYMENQANCTIYINVPSNYAISVYFTYFYFYSGVLNNCNSDFIEVFDNRNNTSLRKLCSTLDPSNSVFSNSNKLKLLLSNSGFMTNYDFTYLASDKGPGCGGDLYNTNGIFTSPFYPGNVRNHSDCRWNIRVPNNLAVQLEFKVFDLGSKVTCHSDYLQIIEQESIPGSSEKTDEMTRQYCGEDLPSTYVGRRNVLSIRFRKTVNFDGTGWVIQFSGIRQRFSLL